MNRLSILSATMLLGVAFIPSSVLAQQQPQTLRQQLVGVWSVTTNALQATASVVGTNPKGYFFLAGSGKFSIVLENSSRPKGAGRSDGMIALFGTWSVDEGAKTLTIRTEGSMNSSLEGTDRKTTIVLNGDELRTTGPENTTNVYRRVPPLPQGTPFRQGLLGAWEVVSLSQTAGVEQVGTKPIGYLMLGGSGRYTSIGKNPNRPKSTSLSADGFIANFGTWSINEADKTLSTRVVGALNQSIEGTESKTTYSMNGNEMTRTNPETKGVSVYRHLPAIQ